MKKVDPHDMNTWNTKELAHKINEILDWIKQEEDKKNKVLTNLTNLGLID